jgi:DNA-binding CsgD family transcriptional regulator|tara:strand:+ start:415 stop:693 length:279 start_codon:yes stop_codon:yes gene_type:complete
MGYFFKEKIKRTTAKSLGRLTNRQQELLVYMLYGCTTEEISTRMGIKESTVRVTIRPMYKFFNKTSREGILSLFIDRKMLQTEVDKMNGVFK